MSSAGTEASQQSTPDSAADPDDEQPHAQLAPDVFISYRLDPDEATAVALRTLIEGSLEPPPRVFVSSAGGLRPSSIGLRPQLQRAVQAVRAFVAIITPQSKEREWVIFEAGAAWGRSQFYAPILIETEPHELGTTVADFVATKADVRDQMEHFIRSLATQLGCTTKTHFGRRFLTFARHLEQRTQRAQGDTMSAPTPESTGASRALGLWHAGKRTEALEEFTRAEMQAVTPEEKAEALIIRLSVIHDNKTYDFRTALDALDAAIRSTASWHAWRGIVEPSAHIAITYYDHVLNSTTSQGNDRDFALIARAGRLFDLGRDHEGTSSLMQELATCKRSRRLGLVTALWDQVGPMAQFMLGLSAISSGSEDVFRRLADLAIEQSWPSIAISTAHKYRSMSDSHHAMNTVGRATQLAGHLSAAYEAYREAYSAGASVARVNIAQLLASSPNPAAARSFLKEHSGDFDSASAEYPYRVRADIERFLEEEREKVTKDSDTGWKTCLVLSQLVDIALADLTSAAPTPVPDAQRLDGQPVALVPLLPFSNLFEVKSKDVLDGLCAYIPAKQEFIEVRVDPKTLTSPTWTTLKAARR